jgi:calcineurin-like phosphoesterase family protein
MHIFLTSDTFFGRKNVLELQSRHHYHSLEEMNRDLIDRWNSKVDKEDVVYHLGNLGWDPFSTSDALQKLNGKIVLIEGEFDSAVHDLKHFHNVKIFFERDILLLEEYKMILSHYPLLDWINKDKNIINCHGYSLDQSRDKSRINVRIDNFGLYPIEIETLMDLVTLNNEEE